MLTALTARAGDYSLPVFIQSAPEIFSNTGQLILDWPNATSTKRWAMLIPRDTRVFLDAAALWGEMTWLIEIRGRLDINQRMRIKTGERPARYMEILAAHSADGRKLSTAERILIPCREQGAVISTVANANQIG